MHDSIFFMKKEFEKWTLIKKAKDHMHEKEIVFFSEREVWWYAGGINIGTEIDGKNEEFSRPVFILKKFNKFGFLGVPLSTSPKVNNYKLPIKVEEGVHSVALLSQIKSLDSRRLLFKIGTLSQEDSIKIKEAIKSMI
jgi:mRNA interferase MazF